MIVPNKFTSFNDSILSKLETILHEVKQDQVISLLELYQKTKGRFVGIDQFMYAIDVLFILGRIDVDYPTRTVKYAK